MFISLSNTLAANWGWVQYLLRFLAIGIAIGTQFELRKRGLSNPVWLGFGVALGLIIASLLPQSGRMSAKKDVLANLKQTQPIMLLRPKLTLLLVVVSIGLAIAGLIIFRQTPNNLAWGLHILSVTALLGAAMAANGLTSADRTSQLKTAAWIGVIAIAALLPRIWDLGDFPFGVWYDEADHANYAVRVVNDPLYRPIYMDSVNIPGHYVYLMAGLFEIFGENTFAMRMTSVVFGVLTCVFGFLLFKHWFGLWAGLIGAAFLIIMRYGLTQSRIAMPGITTPMFELAILYFGERAIRQRKFADFILCGVMLGLSLAFYAPNRIFAAVFAVYFLLRLITTLPRTQFDKKALLTRYFFAISALAVAAVVTIAPVALYTYNNADQVFGRTNQVSLLNPKNRAEPDLTKAILQQSVKHLLMFNVQGDPNGRHNLPNAPMLDNVMAALAVLGFGMALARFWRPSNLSMLMTFGAMLVPGVLSLDFEAPQSLRAVGVLPITAFFASLPLIALLPRENGAESFSFQTITKPKTVLSTLGVLGLLIFSAQDNFVTFFNVQRYEGRAWGEHSISETLVAKEINRLAQTSDFIISKSWEGHPTLRFLAPQAKYQAWDVNHFPAIPASSSRDIVILAESRGAAAINNVRRRYPNAIAREFQSPRGATAGIYEVILTPNDIASNLGGTIRYKQQSAEQAQNFTHFPISLKNNLGNAELNTVINLETSGNYKFNLKAENIENATLFINEFAIKNDESRPLARGSYLLRVSANGIRTDAKLNLTWQKPEAPGLAAIEAKQLSLSTSAAQGLLGNYYRGREIKGEPAFRQIDPEINFYFHNLPLPRPYSVEWQGSIFVEKSGNYVFETVSRDESKFFIADKLLIDNQANNSKIANMTLEKGWHPVKLQFFDYTGYTQVYLYWTPPGGTRQIIPATNLMPPMGKYPETPGKEATTTIAPIQMITLPSTWAEWSPENALKNIQPATASPTTIATQPPVEQKSGSASPLPLGLPTSLKTFGTAGNGAGELREPRGIAVSADGRIFVADSANKRVQVFLPNGNFQMQIEGGEERFEFPSAIVINAQNEVLVLDSNKQWIYFFTLDGKPIKRIAGPNFGLYFPRGLGVDAANNLYVADTGGSKIVKLSPNGDKLQSIGQRGPNAGNLMEPTGIVVAQDGTIFVADPTRSKLVLFNAQGEFIREFSIRPASTVDGPQMVIESENTVLLTSPAAHVIQRVDKNRGIIAEFGGEGNQPGQMRLPTGLALHNKTVWVVETAAHRIQQLEIK